MKFFSYICNCVALDTGMCGCAVLRGYLAKSINNTTFAVYCVPRNTCLRVRSVPKTH